jgi:hypothetical protein
MSQKLHTVPQTSPSADRAFSSAHGCADQASSVLRSARARVVSVDRISFDPRQPDRIAGYRIGEEQSADVETTVQLAGRRASLKQAEMVQRG